MVTNGGNSKEMKILYRIGITACLVLSLFMSFKFYNVAIPIKVQDTEAITIKRMAQAFNITYEVSKIFVSHGRLKGIDPVLLASIAVPESGNNPNAVSPKGYKGRMQSDTHKYQFDSVEILNGTEKLVQFMKYANGDIVQALAMYNGGTNPQVYNSRQCQGYAKTVLKIYTNAREIVYSRT